MRFTIDTAQLNAGISTVTKALAVKTTIGILEGVYIHAEGNNVLLRCTDLSLQIETVLPAAVEEEGAIVLPGRLFSEMARRFPGETTLISSEGRSAYLESGRSKTTIQGEPADEYHSMPEVKNEYSVTIKKRSLKDMIRSCIFATAQDDTKPVLTGVLMELENNSMSLVALDGYRLAIRNEEVPEQPEYKKAIIPAKSLVEISRILEDTEESINVVFSSTHVLIDIEYTRIKTRLMEGEFIKYKQILPVGQSTRVRIDRTELLGAIERVALMAREGKSNLIRFSFASDTAKLSANSGVGHSTEELDVNILGSDLDIAFNAKYFSDVLKVLEDKEVFLDMNNSINPCVIRPIQGNAFYYLILPVRTFAGA